MVTGFPDGTFRPDDEGTRAHFASMLARAFVADESFVGELPYDDVPSDHWAREDIGIATAAGFMEG